ncbi:MAG: hypothetical protein LBP76_09640, partial [Treponema sp.]|nr:hypothetical protein [Treponema sp.]
TTPLFSYYASSCHSRRAAPAPQGPGQPPGIQPTYPAAPRGSSIHQFTVHQIEKLPVGRQRHQAHTRAALSLI